MGSDGGGFLPPIPITYVNVRLPCVGAAILRGGITRTHTQTNPPGGGGHPSATSSQPSSTFGLGGSLRLSQLGGTSGGGLGGGSLKSGEGKLSPVESFTLGAVPAHYRPSLAILQACESRKHAHAHKRARTGTHTYTLSHITHYAPPPTPPLDAALMACLRSILTVLPETVQKDLAFKAPSAALKAAVLAAISN